MDDFIIKRKEAFKWWDQRWFRYNGIMILLFMIALVVHQWLFPFAMDIFITPIIGLVILALNVIYYAIIAIYVFLIRNRKDITMVAVKGIYKWVVWLTCLLIFTCFVIAYLDTETVRKEHEKINRTINENVGKRLKQEEMGKWLMYCYNYKDTCISLESDRKEQVLRCDVRLEDEQYRKDTVKLLYSFYPQDNGLMRLQIQPNTPNTVICGIRIINDTFIHPCFIGAFEYDFESHPDSMRKVNKEVEQEFIEFIKGYNGQINPWLREELKRRGISWYTK